MIPEESRGELEALLELSAPDLRKLHTILGDKRSLKEGRGYRRVASELAIGNSQALKVFSATSNVRAQRERFELSDDDLLVDLATFADGQVLDDDRRKALLELFAKNDDDYFIHKLDSLKHALVPHFIDARAIVDARPVFDKERTRIDGFLLVTTLEVTTHDPGSDDYSSISVYLRRKDITTLQERLRDAEAKLATLEAALKPADVFD